MTTILLIAAALVGAEAARGASARKLVEEGNQAYHGGEYEEALKSYERAAEQDPDSGRIHFNKGAALYRQGDYSKALGEFEQAAVAGSAAADRELEARAQYNAGNSLFRQSEQKQSKDPRGAVDLLGRSTQAYQRALRLNPALADAAHNLEVARLQMKRLLEQAQNMPQSGQGQQDSQNQDLSQQLQKLLDQQQQASREGEKLAEQQQQQGNSQNLQDKTQQLSEKQQEIQQQTEELSKQLEQQQQQSQSQQSQQQQQQQQQQVKQNLDRAASHQQQAQNKLDQQQLPGAGEEQKKAEDALRQALQAAEKQAGGQQDEQQQAQAQQQQAEAEPQPQQEGTPQDQPQSDTQSEGHGDEAPTETARNILDEERANRKQRQIRQMRGIRPVEKDW